MQLIQDPFKRWVGRPAFARKVAGNRPPVALDDQILVEVDGPTVRIAVLDNDIDFEGGALSLVSAFAALGTAVAEADGTVSYTPPPGISGFDTVTYEIADDQGQTDSGQIDITITVPSLSVDATNDNRLEITAGTGQVDLTLTAPAAFAGDYSFDTSLLSTGPVVLSLPVVLGETETQGATVDALGGLWAHDSSTSPVQTWQWRRGGTAIPGETGPSHVVVADDIGTGLNVVETWTDGLGSRSAASFVAFTPGSDPAVISWFDADDAATISGGGGKVFGWSDKIGNFDLGQSSDPRRPFTGLRSIGGRNAIDFDGSQYLTGAMTLPASGDLAIHMVVEIDAVASAFAGLVSVDATNDFQFDADANTQFDGRLNTTGIATAVSLTGAPLQGVHLISILFDFTGTGTARVFVDDIERASTAYTTALDASVDFNIFTNRSQNAWIDGATAEVIVTEDVTNRATHHAYLASKWGLV